MKAPEPYWTAREAAAYLGYKPTGGPSRHDPAMHAFYERVASRRIQKHRFGRLLRFKRVDLDAACPRADAPAPPTSDRFAHMEHLARAHAAGRGERHG